MYFLAPYITLLQLFPDDQVHVHYCLPPLKSYHSFLMCFYKVTVTIVLVVFCSHGENLDEI